MNNNKKILKRSSAAFLAALNIFNFAGGSSKALNSLELLKESKKQATEEEVQKIVELKKFLDSFAGMDFVRKNVDELKSEGCLIELNNIKNTCFNSSSSKCYKLNIDEKEKKVLFLDFKKNFNEKGLNEVLECFQGIGKSNSSRAKQNLKQALSNFNKNFVIYKIEKDVSEDETNIKKILNNCNDINFIDAYDIERLRSFCENFEEKQNLKKELNEKIQELETEKEQAVKAKEDAEINKNELEKTIQNLKEANENAEQEKKDLANANEQAVLAQKKAEQEKNEAVEAKEKAEKAKEQAVLAQKKAEQEKNEAVEAQQKAEQEKKEAVSNLEAEKENTKNAKKELERQLNEEKKKAENAEQEKKDLEETKKKSEKEKTNSECSVQAKILDEIIDALNKGKSETNSLKRAKKGFKVEPVQDGNIKLSNGFTFQLFDDKDFLGSKNIIPAEKINCKQFTINNLIEELNKKSSDKNTIKKLEAIKEEDVKELFAPDPNSPSVKEIVFKKEAFGKKIDEYIEILEKLRDKLDPSIESQKKIKELQSELEKKEKELKAKNTELTKFQEELNDIENKLSELKSFTNTDKAERVQELCKDYLKLKDEKEKLTKNSGSGMWKSFAVTGWLGTFLGLVYIFKEELKGAYHLAYDKVLALKNKMLNK